MNHSNWLGNFSNPMLGSAAAMDSEILTVRLVIFGVSWILLTVTTTVVFSRVQSAERKRRLVPWFASAFAVLFLGMSIYLGVPAESLFLTVPMIAFMLVFNIRAIRFCNSCSAYNPSTPRMQARFCRKCGHSLENSAL